MGRNPIGWHRVVSNLDSAMHDIEDAAYQVQYAQPEQARILREHAENVKLYADRYRHRLGD